MPASGAVRLACSLVSSLEASLTFLRMSLSDFMISGIRRKASIVSCTQDSTGSVTLMLKAMLMFTSRAAAYRSFRVRPSLIM